MGSNNIRFQFSFLPLVLTIPVETILACSVGCSYAYIANPSQNSRTLRPMCLFLFLSFGAMLRSPSTGIIMNNGMDDFSVENSSNSFGLQWSPANLIAPHKRPLSSMCPTIITDAKGNVHTVFGGAGGSRITSGSALVSLRPVCWSGVCVFQRIKWLQRGFWRLDSLDRDFYWGIQTFPAPLVPLQVRRRGRECQLQGPFADRCGYLSQRLMQLAPWENGA